MILPKIDQIELVTNDALSNLYAWHVFDIRKTLCQKTIEHLGVFYRFCKKRGSTNRISIGLCCFHGPSIISAASNVVFWTFFRAKTCCVVCHACCFCYKYGAKKCLKNHIPFEFWDDSTSANQGAGKAIEKPLKELPWNQQDCCCNISVAIPNGQTLKTSVLEFTWGSHRNFNNVNLESYT